MKSRGPATAASNACVQHAACSTKQTTPAQHVPHSSDTEYYLPTSANPSMQAAILQYATHMAWQKGKRHKSQGVACVASTKHTTSQTAAHSAACSMQHAACNTVTLDCTLWTRGLRLCSGQLAQTTSTTTKAMGHGHGPRAQPVERAPTRRRSPTSTRSCHGAGICSEDSHSLGQSFWRM